MRGVAARNPGKILGRDGAFGATGALGAAGSFPVMLVILISS